MEKRKTRSVIIAAAVICVLILGIVLILPSGTGRNKDSIDLKSLPISYDSVVLAYTPRNLEEEIGMADYVFLAEVTQMDEPHYTHVVTQKKEDGSVTQYGTPYTDYVVRVRENLKGKLLTDEPIRVTKDGGVSIRRDCIVLLGQGDSLPEEGKLYIFTAWAQLDGSLLLSGASSNLLVGTTASGLTEDGAALLDEYREAAANEIVPYARERAVSLYDPDFLAKGGEAQVEAERQRTEDRETVLAEYRGRRITRAMLKNKYGSFGETEERTLAERLILDQIAVDEAEERGLLAAEEGSVREMTAAARAALADGPSEETDPVLLYCRGRDISPDVYLKNVVEYDPACRAHFLLCAEFAREYCEEHGLEYRLGAQPDEVNAAVEAALNALFEAHKAEIVYY